MNDTQKSPAQPTVAQPQAALEMNAMNAPKVACIKDSHDGCEHKASRIRGGGAGKDCFLGLVSCFLCFECCECCCGCVADIICCPCEMCC